MQAVHSATNTATNLGYREEKQEKRKEKPHLKNSHDENLKP
jgi:hypothetical protein